MDIIPNLKLDRWYRIILYLGIILMVLPMIFTISFLEAKHAIGFGLGLVMIGISFTMAERVAHQFEYGGFFSWDIIKHNLVSYIILIIGIGLALLFGFLIVKELI